MAEIDGKPNPNSHAETLKRLERKVDYVINLLEAQAYGQQNAIDAAQDEREVWLEVHRQRRKTG